jgi:hypothetical protein
MPRSPHHLADELDRGAAELEELGREARAEIRDDRHYNLLEERGEAIRRRIRSAFRDRDPR